MNNYSWLQQKLHQLALSTNFMREIAFDAESSIIPTPKGIDNHIFVSGLARSGTTTFLNALHESNKFASPTYKDMPFILAPNLWSKISFTKKNIDSIERAHGDGIKISSESPEAFEEVFWKTFNDSNFESAKKFKIFVKLITYKYNRDRYLSKNNQNIKRLDLISQIFPNSKILILYRDPIQQAFSLLSQHIKFIENSKKDKFISDYMKWIGHTEFGPNYIPINKKNLFYFNDLDINHWLEQWYLAYKNCYETFQNCPNIYFISYERLCRSDEYWHELLKILEIVDPKNFSFKESLKEVSQPEDLILNKKAYSLYAQLDQLDIN